MPYITRSREPTDRLWLLDYGRLKPTRALHRVLLGSREHMVATALFQWHEIVRARVLPRWFGGFNNIETQSMSNGRFPNPHVA